jgi:tryptophanyl-tRNA synthetase
MNLIRRVNADLADLRARRAELVKNPETVWRVLKEGAIRARERASATMADVRKAMKIDWQYR